jgi:cytochrome c
MKKLFVIALAAAFAFTSCGPKKEESKDESAEAAKEGEAYEEYETAEPAQASSTDLIAQGETLINSSDCKTCHTNENKIVGPAYKEVAAKYEFTRANISLLAGKVISGGTGVWGDLPMTAHPDLSTADAEKMVMYVLSLDGEQPKD